MQIESRGETLTLTETDTLLYAQETDSLRELLQKIVKERDELACKLRQSLHTTEQLKGVILGLKRPDGHLGIECKLTGCSWPCKKAKEIIPELK